MRLHCSVLVPSYYCQLLFGVQMIVFKDVSDEADDEPFSAIVTGKMPTNCYEEQAPLITTRVLWHIANGDHSWITESI